MKFCCPSSHPIWRWLVAVAVVLWPAWGLAQEKKPAPPPAGIYIELSDDFYRALSQAAAQDSGTLGTSSQTEDYLRQIAVSTKFMVETNLQLMRQQERILQLLEEIREKNSHK